MKLRHCLLVFLPVALVGFVFILPFGVRYTSHDTREAVNQHLFLYRESGKLSGLTEDSLARHLWRFIALRVRNPEFGEKVNDTNWMSVYNSRMGSCDQQAWLLIELARAYGISGRLVFLYGADSVSKHSVAELYINKHWQMYDPYYGIVLSNNEGVIQGLKELTRQPGLLKTGRRVILTGHGVPDEVAYAGLFESKYPYQVKPLKQLDAVASCWYSIARFNSWVFRDLFDRFRQEI